MGGAAGGVAADGVALKIRTEVVPLASDEIAGYLKELADLYEAGDPAAATQAQADAGVSLREACSAAGVEF